MSTALQSAGSALIKNVIKNLTTNKFMAVIVGMLVTCIVQSSSVTTVMVVGFVNAGLMGLTQAIGVIFGANIGTTITGWIISIKIGKYGLLLIGAGAIPALFAKNSNWKNFGQIMFGVGMIFFGLENMSSAFKPLRTNTEFLSFISTFSDNNLPSYAMSALVGCLLTTIVQSSSAMLGITMTLATTGIIDFQTSVALVMGENIGTTITALLASVGANTNGKRAARAHAIFNLLGVVVMLIFLPVYLELIEWLIPGDANLIGPEGNRDNIAAHIAAGHTVFNVSATILFLPFLNKLARLVIWLTPEPKNKEVHHLIMLGNPQDTIPTTAIVQAMAEISKFQIILERMFETTKEYILLDKEDSKTLAKINNFENITDNIEKEITIYLCQVMEKPLEAHQTHKVQSIIRISDEFESIADYLANLAHYKSRFMTEAGPLKGQGREDFLNLVDNVWEFVHLCCNGIESPESFDETIMIRKSDELITLSNSLRERHLGRIKDGEYKPLTGMTYSDMVVALRKIRSHAFNVGQATKGLKD